MIRRKSLALIALIALSSNLKVETARAMDPLTIYVGAVAGWSIGTSAAAIMAYYEDKAYRERMTPVRLDEGLCTIRYIGRRGADEQAGSIELENDLLRIDGALIKGSLIREKGRLGGYYEGI